MYSKHAFFQVYLLGYDGQLEWIALGDKGMVVILPRLGPATPSWGWTLKISNLNEIVVNAT